MATEAQPVPGNWYFNQRSQQLFQVVGLDSEDDAVEIQHDDGNLDTIPIRAWYGLDVRPAEAPIDPEAVFSDTEEGQSDYLAEDPHAAQLPSAEEQNRRDKVEYAGKSGKGFPEPRPERGPGPDFETGSEQDLDRWRETRE